MVFCNQSSNYSRDLKTKYKKCLNFFFKRILICLSQMIQSAGTLVLQVSGRREITELEFLEAF